MGKQSAPQPPSVQQTAAAQTGTNVSTALAQQQLNSVNQVGPDGSLKYDQTGTYTFTDPATGQTYNLPRMTATTTLSPELQALKDTGQRTSQNLATLGESQSQRLSGLLAEPFSLNNDATESRLMELASKRLDPMLDRRRESENTRLANQGIKVNSTAYDRAMEQVNQGENDARNQLLLTGRNQAVQEALLQRNQPLNEIIGLSTGTQIGTPSFAGTPQTGIPTTDVAGLTQANYQQQYQQWLQGQQNNNALLGGLFGLGSAAIIASDKRLKEDVKKIGKTDDGIPIVTYRYKGDPVPHMGFLAQDVAKKKPEAVHKTLSGFLAVDMDKALEAA